MDDRNLKWEGLIVIGGLLFGFLPIFSVFLRNLGLSSIEQVFLRLFITLFIGIVLILIFIRNSDYNSYMFKRPFQETVMFQGLFLTLAITAYFSSISLGLPVGEAALLIQIHPVVTFILAFLFLKEPITRMKLFSLGLALIGVIILLRPWEAAFFTFIVGDVLSIANGIFYSAYLVVGRRYLRSSSNTNISSLLLLGWVFVWSFIVGVPLLFAISILPISPNITNFSFESFLVVEILIFGLGMAVIGSFIPYIIIMFTSKIVESTRSAILLLGEPIGAIFFGFILFSEKIEIQYIIGGGILLFAIVLLIGLPEETNTKEYY